MRQIVVQAGNNKNNFLPSTLLKLEDNVRARYTSEPEMNFGASFVLALLTLAAYLYLLTFLPAQWNQAEENCFTKPQEESLWFKREC